MPTVEKEGGAAVTVVNDDKNVVTATTTTTSEEIEVREGWRFILFCLFQLVHTEYEKEKHLMIFFCICFVEKFSKADQYLGFRVEKRKKVVVEKHFKLRNIEFYY